MKVEAKPLISQQLYYKSLLQRPGTTQLTPPKNHHRLLKTGKGFPKKTKASTGHHNLDLADVTSDFSSTKHLPNRSKFSTLKLTQEALAALNITQSIKAFRVSNGASIV